MKPRIFELSTLTVHRKNWNYRLWQFMEINKYFGMLFLHISFVAFRFRAIFQLLERRRHHRSWLHFYVLCAALCFYAFATIDTSLERMCVGNAKRSEVHYRELGHGEYITRRIWPGYVADSMACNLTWWRRLSTLELKKLLQVLWVVCVTIIYARDVRVYLRN